MKAEQNQKVGIIDIGSNSVRMVVYHAPNRVPLPLYNEKHFCGLGASIAKNGRLDKSGKDEARDALLRFKEMAHRLSITSLDILATAALRDAEDADAFREELETLMELPIHVISGKEEARLAALGVVASFASPHGIVADLGGGSMEVGILDNGQLRDLSSAPIGVLREKQHKKLKEHLERLPAPSTAFSTLYAVGGSFRAIAKMHMKLNLYPLDLLHGYVMKRKQVKKIAEMLSKMTPHKITKLPGIPKRRATCMAYASHLLLALMDRYGSDRVIFSVSGIREGFLYDSLPNAQKAEDPLLSSAHDLALFCQRHGHYAAELFEWGKPLFGAMPERSERLRHACCILSEIAWQIDPNFRGEWLYNRFVQSSLKGMDHVERVMISLALYHRHESKWKEDLKLLNEEQMLWSKAVGLSLRVASELTGGISGYLPKTKLYWLKNHLTLELDESSQPLLHAKLQKYLDGLGDTLNALSKRSI